MRKSQSLHASARKYFNFETEFRMYLRSQNYVTFFIAMLFLSMSHTIMTPFFCQATDSLEIAGTGDSQSLLRMLAPYFMQSRPDLTVEIPDSIGSGGGIKGLLANRYELVRTARPLKAKEQDGTLVEYPFALSPVVFAVHPTATGIDNLTTTQIIGIYTGAIKSWDQLGGPASPIYPVDREPGDSSRVILEDHMPGFKEMKSVAKIFYTTPETIAAISQHQYTIGFLPHGPALDAQLQVVTIDGSAPAAVDIKNGSYPYVCTYFLVARKPVSKQATQFIDFIYSPEARAFMTKRGLIPLDKKQ